MCSAPIWSNGAIFVNIFQTSSKGNVVLKTLSLLFFLFSCSGYRVVSEKNPYKDRGIFSVSVPMFINRSSISGASPIFTSTIKNVLERETDLKIYAGNNKDSDAVLVGLIDSETHLSKLYQAGSSKFIEGELKESIGSRQEFYIPTDQNYRLTLTLVLVRRPKKEDMALIQSELLSQLYIGEKFLFRKTILLDGSFSRELRPNLTSDDGGVVSFSARQGAFKKSLKSLGDVAARVFREEILNVF